VEVEDAITVRTRREFLSNKHNPARPAPREIVRDDPWSGRLGNPQVCIRGAELGLVVSDADSHPPKHGVGQARGMRISQRDGGGEGPLVAGGRRRKRSAKRRNRERKHGSLSRL
jgi:hypothetical protein